MGKNPDLLHGTMNMLILKAVSLGPLHGYAVLLRIQQLAAGGLEIQQGTLYPALYRLEHQGLLQGEWGESDNKRRARFYSLTPAGRHELAAERAKWERMAGMIGGILNAEAPEGGAA